jgi:hypothetical protein
VRTADTIAQQSEASKSFKGKIKKRRRRNPNDNRGKNPNSLKNLIPYVRGVSGNPGGLPGCDIAAVIARAVIENNQERAYEGFAKQLEAGNAYAFKELADRGYGKLKERLEHSVSEDVLKALEAGRKRAAAR